MLKAAFEALEIAEGYVRAAVWEEECGPPFERGPTYMEKVKHLELIQATLAALQIEMKQRKTPDEAALSISP